MKFSPILKIWLYGPRRVAPEDKVLGLDKPYLTAYKFKMGPI